MGSWRLNSVQSTSSEDYFCFKEGSQGIRRSYFRAFFFIKPHLNYSSIFFKVSTQKIKMKIAIYSLLFLVSLGKNASGRPDVNLIINTGSSVEEVIKPEAKELVLSEFTPIQVLRNSLPNQGSGPHALNVEVESPVLFLTKPKNRPAKRKEQAEKRTQGLSALYQVPRA